MATEKLTSEKDKGSSNKRLKRSNSTSLAESGKVSEFNIDWACQTKIVPLDEDQTNIEYLIKDQRLCEILKQQNILNLYSIQKESFFQIIQSYHHLKASKLYSYQSIGFIRSYMAHDVMIRAPTGYGKTLAYTLPLIHLLPNRIFPMFRALVIVPNRDLALQVFYSFCSVVGLVVHCTIGSEGSVIWEKEKKIISSPFDILITTPGRFVDHLFHSNISLKHLEFIVIDEADRLVNQTYNNWLYYLNQFTQQNNGQISLNKHGLISSFDFFSSSSLHLKILSSATLSIQPQYLPKIGLFSPVLITTSLLLQTPHQLSEKMVICSEENKPLILIYLLSTLNVPSLIFTNSVESASRLSRLLKLFDRFSIREYSGLISQKQKHSILQQFQKGLIQYLVCTDSLSRGIDLPNARAIINYESPLQVKTYIHRAGRTARLGPNLKSQSEVYTLLIPQEISGFKNLLRKCQNNLVQFFKIQPSDYEVFREEYEKNLNIFHSL